MQGDQEPSPEWLREKYEDEGLSTWDIALELGISRYRATHLLKEAGVIVEGNESESYKELRRRAMETEPQEDRETLEGMYNDLGMTQEQIAEVFDVTQSTVSYWFKKHGIETGYRPDVPDELDDPEVLDHYYHDLGYDAVDMATKFDVAKRVVEDKLRQHDIPFREDEAPEGIRNRKWLADRLHKDELSEEEIADLADCSVVTVKNWRRRHML